MFNPELDELFFRLRYLQLCGKLTPEVCRELLAIIDKAEEEPAPHGEVQELPARCPRVNPAGFHFGLFRGTTCPDCGEYIQ